MEKSKERVLQSLLDFYKLGQNASETIEKYARLKVRMLSLQE